MNKTEKEVEAKRSLIRLFLVFVKGTQSITNFAQPCSKYKRQRNQFDSCFLHRHVSPFNDHKKKITPAKLHKQNSI